MCISWISASTTAIVEETYEVKPSLEIQILEGYVMNLVRMHLDIASISTHFRTPCSGATCSLFRRSRWDISAQSSCVDALTWQDCHKECTHHSYCNFVLGMI
mmetsp:Transcript_6119/g.37962  ORF Transcript_6119/g.37962 Transcript_6119/m.37962 type:complete len:102 (-) Transcript_6119:1225-1530(-)